MNHQSSIDLREIGKNAGLKEDEVNTIGVLAEQIHANGTIPVDVPSIALLLIVEIGNMEIIKVREND